MKNDKQKISASTIDTVLVHLSTTISTNDRTSEIVSAYA